MSLTPTSSSASSDSELPSSSSKKTHTSRTKKAGKVSKEGSWSHTEAVSAPADDACLGECCDYMRCIALRFLNWINKISDVNEAPNVYMPPQVEVDGTNQQMWVVMVPGWILGAICFLVLLFFDALFDADDGLDQTIGVVAVADCIMLIMSAAGAHCITSVLNSKSVATLREWQQLQDRPFVFASYLVVVGMFRLGVALFIGLLCLIAFSVLDHLPNAIWLAVCGGGCVLTCCAWCIVFTIAHISTKSFPIDGEHRSGAKDGGENAIDKC